MTAAMQRLNLGCGTSAAEGWVNLDGSWAAWLGRHRQLRRALVTAGVVPRHVLEADWPRDVIVRDLRRRLPFAPGSVDAIYASHVIEHLYRTEARRLLDDCFRVLRAGGTLRVVVPDLAAIVSDYAERTARRSRNGGSDADGDACERLNGRLMLRQERPPSGPLYLRLYRFFSDFHSHKWVYDGPCLVQMFRSAGFGDAATRPYRESAIPGIDEVERPDRVLGGEGICVEGTRS